MPRRFNEQMIMTMKSNLIKYAMLGLILAAFGLTMSCSTHEKERVSMAQKDQLTKEEWTVIARRRIIFGHQSVGNNILSGVRTLAKEAGVNLSITESRDIDSRAGITHFKVGRNTEPMSKIEDFARVMEGAEVQAGVVALVKLCYIDFDSGTDAKKLAEEYCSSLDRLSRKFPKAGFIAVTAPLTTIQSGPKAWVKRLLRRTPSGYAENERRREFNDYLRARYSRQGRLFDLAGIEAEGAGNLQFQGHRLETLNPALTDDGGHLNSPGEAYVAAKFLKFIASYRFADND
jgi:hypothetical protein